MRECATYVSVGVVTLVAAVVSFVHMKEVAAFAGEEWRAWLLPLSVDGLVTAGSLAAFRASRNGEAISAMTVVSLCAGLAVSLSANMIAPFLGELPEQASTVLSAVVSAWPAVALALAFEQLLRLQNPSAEYNTDQGQGLVEEVSGDDTAEESIQAPVEGDQLTGQTLTAAEAKAAALETLRSNPDTSAETLGEMFGRSSRWGRDRRKAFRNLPSEEPHLVAVG